MIIYCYASTVHVFRNPCSRVLRILNFRLRIDREAADRLDQNRCDLQDVHRELQLNAVDLSAEVILALGRFSTRDRIKFSMSSLRLEAGQPITLARSS